MTEPKRTKGIVAVLDEQTRERVQNIWYMFQAEFGVHGVSSTPYPHFSFHVAQDYDRSGLIPDLTALAEVKAALSLQTAGLGIFTGMRPVLHINVVRSTALNRLHQAIFNRVEPYATSSQQYYTANQWLPHITLAMHDFSTEQILDAIALLLKRDLNWSIEITALALLENHQSEPSILWELSG